MNVWWWWWRRRAKQASSSSSVTGAISLPVRMHACMTLAYLEDVVVSWGARCLRAYLASIPLLRI